MSIPIQTVPEGSRNQSSIDRALNLPKSPALRKNTYNAGLREIKRQKALPSGVTIIEKLDEILIGRVKPTGGFEYKEPVKDPKKAIAILKANPKWFAADGVYNGKGTLTIYATATSPETKLSAYEGTLLAIRLRSPLGFNLRLTGIENVIQTIAHELGHHKGYSHADNAIYNDEYRAVKAYRSKQ